VSVELAERERLLDRRQIEILDRLAGLVALRDPETGVHSGRIGAVSARLARACRLPEQQAREIGLAAPLHDIGKLAIPDAVLLKPGPLDAAERELMQGHAKIGHDVLAGTGVPLMDLAAEIALTHHERFDGSGYPRGLAAGEIPIAGRIVAIADAFDFLVSDRPYHRAITPRQAIKVLSTERGSHFDPFVLDSFTEVLPAIVVEADRQLAKAAEDL
jgi:putative two-component system response regulator